MDNYLYGYRVHKLDAKSRVAIPAHMRGRLLPHRTIRSYAQIPYIKYRCR